MYVDQTSFYSFFSFKHSNTQHAYNGEPDLIFATLFLRSEHYLIIYFCDVILTSFLL